MKPSIYIALLALGLNACTSELDQVNPNQVTAVNFWKTEGDVLSGLVASYKCLRDLDRGYWNARGVELSNSRGDDFFIRNDITDLYRISTFTNNATNSVSANIFTSFYTTIFRANLVIEKVPGAQLSDALKKQYIAEAKFLRGLSYFYLAINFGTAPVYTAVPSNDVTTYPGRSTEAQVYAQAISDLRDAKDGLPLSYPADMVGRATKGSAIGLLGKAYVYTGNWAAAEAEFRLLASPAGQPVSPFQYDLLANYEQNFLVATENNQESLFEIQFQNTGASGFRQGENANEAQSTLVPVDFGPSEAGGFYEAFPTDKMFNEFARERTTTNDFDPRMYASLAWDYPGSTFYTLPYRSITSQFGYHSHIKKYQNYTFQIESNGTYQSDNNERVLRYADILLMYAEAVTMQGRPAEAYPLVNRIRSRASLAALPAGYSNTQMMAEIRHQRMVEFFREGLRFYDLKRWGLLQQEITSATGNALVDKVGKEFFATKFTYLPIPQAELNTNPNIDQSPSWR